MRCGGTLMRVWLWFSWLWLGAMPAAWAQAAGAASAADGLQAVPPLTARVVDRSGTLSGAQRDALEGKLAAFEAQHGTQIVVLLLPSTQPEDIAAYAFRVADTWKIGRRQVGDGLLVVVATQDHRARIEVARALEGAVPDVIAGRIITGTMAPAFKVGDYAGGLNLAVEQLMAQVAQGGTQAAPAQPGLSTAPAAATGGGEDIPNWLIVFLLGVLVGMVLVRAWLGPGLGALVMGGIAGTGAGLAGGLQIGLIVALGVAVVTLMGLGNFLLTVLSNVGSGRGGSGGGGGGGFSSGGGGSFGGGGASGSW